jgi:hypothetical protein
MPPGNAYKMKAKAAGHGTDIQSDVPPVFQLSPELLIYKK